MKLWISGFLLLASLEVLSQPANDDCLTAIDLGVVPYCEDTYFTNVGASPSDIGPNNIPPCWDAGTVQRDVWISFIASDTILDYSITITGESDGISPPLTNPQVAVYRGDCGPGSLFFYGCYKTSTLGSNNLKFSLSGLTPGAVYWLRIADFPESSSVNAGTFKLCIEPKSPITNIIEGFSKDCEGLLTDSGGPDNDYGPNETYTFTICPEFPSACIDLNFIYYNMDFNQDVITIYDGPDVNSPQIGTIVGGFGNFQDSWGGVCKRFSATSGCLTVRFVSNGTNEFDGFLAEWVCSPVPCKTYTQPLIQSAFTESEVLLNLTSTQAIVTYDTLICADGASGLFFNGDQTDLGLNKGILLTTGGATLALGPNNTPAATGGNGTPGDLDLDILSTLSGNTQTSFDACILELDVYANTDEISFEYIFGSEEYPEFVGPGGSGESFNDIFAFLISGPGITGIPQINNQDNMAILPGGTYVQIDSVNYQYNWQYYRDNLGGQSIQYDGLTSDFLGKKKSLTARYTVTPCNTYHLKLAIADRTDSSYDSGVFISEIKGGAPAIAMNFKNGVDYLVEDCTNNPDELVITLNSPLENQITYNVAIGGSATLGVDYALNIPSIITFQPGETLLSFPIVPLSDNIAEGDETITITLSNDFGCGSVIFAVFTIIIRDELKISVNGGLDTAFFCPATSVTLNAEGAQDFFWEPVSIFNDPTSASTQATPPQSMWVLVTGQLGVCTAIDSIYLLEVNPQIQIQNASPQEICEGEVVTLIANTNLQGQGSIFWTPTFGLNPSTGPIVNANPPFSIQYIVTANLTGCEARDTIDFNVDPFDFPLVIPDVTICQGNSIKLANDILFTGTEYTWTPGTGLDETNISGPVASPDVTTLYKLVATSASGFCADSAQTLITVVPAVVEIAQPDTVFLCLGDSISLNASFTSGGTLTWLPADSSKLIQTGNNAIAYGTQSFWAFSEMTVGPCTVTDSIWIQVDSLPDLTISRFLDKPIYCEGEIITFISQNYLNQDYPDIEHLWSPNNGAFLTADSNLNIVLTARESFTYTRQTKNNACVESQSVSIQVIPIGLTLSQSAITLCPGDTMQVFVLDDNIENIMWTPTEGLSCSDCTDPVITGTSTIYYQVKGDEQGCNKQGGVAVDVPVPVLDLPQSIILCLGESANLNPAAGTSTTYFWTSSDPTFGTSTDANPLVSPIANAIYYVTATLDGCERTGEVPVAVIVPPTVAISAPSNSICFGESITLTAAGLPVGGDYLWNPDQQTSAAIQVSPPVSTQYSVIYTTVNGCFSDTVFFTLSVDVPLQIDLEIEPNQDSFLLGTPITVTANVVPAPPAGSTYQWKINGAVVPGATTSILETTASEQPFVVTVEITTPADCENISSTTYTVTIPTYKLANLFTPNNDDTNDFFTIILDPGLTVTDFKVFSRWGKMVYDNDNPVEGWDGTLDGKELPSDVYAYVITLLYGDGSTVVLRGDVTLVR